MSLISFPRIFFQDYKPEKASWILFFKAKTRTHDDADASKTACEPQVQIIQSLSCQNLEQQMRRCA